jgi:hypothetical protein
VTVRSRGRLWPVVAVAFFSALVASQDGQAQKPTYRLVLSDEVGQSSRYRLSFDIRMRAEIQGGGQPDAGAEEFIAMLAEGMALRTVMEYEQRLMAVEPDGVRLFEVVWHDYEFEGELAGKEIPPPSGLLASTRDLLSQTAKVRTTAAGQTVEASYSHPRLAGLARSFEQTDGGMPTYLPEIPVAVGDRWTGSARIPLGLGTGAGSSLVLELEHTLREVREGPSGSIAVIELAGRYSQLQAGDEITFGIPLHMEATLTGSSLFNISEGRFTGGHYELDMFALHAEGGVEVHLTGHADGTQELLTGR